MTPCKRAIPTEFVALAAIIAIAAVLRLGGIGRESFWYDETLTAKSAAAPTTQIFAAVRQHENSPPLYFLIANLWSKVFGLSDVSLRLPSALFGITALLVLWRVGAELFDSTIGLTAAALLALSPMHIAYSQEARAYSLLVLLLLLCVWAFLRMLKTGSPRAQAMYVVTAALSLYAHTFAVFTLLALNLFYLVRLPRKQPPGVRLRRLVILHAVILVLFGPWIPATIEVARMGLPWLIRSAPFQSAMLSYTGSFAAGLVAGVLVLLAVAKGIAKRDERLWLLLLLMIVPVLAPILYGTFTTRYGIGSLIGLTLLLAYGASVPGRAGSVVIVILGAAQWWTTSTLGRPRYHGDQFKPETRPAVEYAVEHARPGDAVYINLNRPLWHAFEHYARARPFPQISDLTTASANRVWVMASPNDPIPPSRYQIVSRHEYDGVVLLELQGEPATLRAVPTSSPIQ